MQGLRDENDALRRRVAELERVAALRDSEAGRVVEDDEAPAVPPEFAPVATLFSMSRVPKLMIAPMLTQRVGRGGVL